MCDHHRQSLLPVLLHIQLTQSDYGLLLHLHSTGLTYIHYTTVSISTSAVLLFPYVRNGLKCTVPLRLRHRL